MKLGIIFFFSVVLVGCNPFNQQSQSTVVQEAYFVPLIRSDVSSSGYTPSVIPTTQEKQASRIYTPVLR